MTETVIKPDFEAGQKHFIFTQEHEDLRESMESWAKKELHPHRNEWEETKWPDSAIERAGELGYLGLCFPEEYGGQGGDYFYSLVRAEALSYAGNGGIGMGFAGLHGPALVADLVPEIGQRVVAGDQRRIEIRIQAVVEFHEVGIGIVDEAVLGVGHGGSSGVLLRCVASSHPVAGSSKRN